ncbi:MAG: MSMEG_0565 family glycosyltransferase [Acidimicrobiales bacterium]|nr:MSMEG_0565 family glycosyltransferase [Acidimicrobiales bacterium]
MRVALLTYSTRPRGGVVHTLALAEALARHVDVTVFSLARGGDDGFFRSVDPAVDVRLAHYPDRPGETVGERVERSIELLGAAVDPSEFDIVHAQDCISANAVPGGIRTVHHLDTFTTPQLAACHERAIVQPRAHVCVSSAVAAELREGWDIDATVIPNGVEAERFVEAAGRAGTDARDDWRLRVGAPFVLAVGGIEPRKGTIDLVDAMARLRSHVDGVELVIAGGETLFDYREYRAAFDDRCAATGIEPIVLGPVAHDDLPSLVAAADVFAFPSTKEGFGLAAMEALAAGVPVVVRDLPVLREVFGHSVAYASTAEELADELALPLIGVPSSNRCALGVSLARSLSWAAAAERHVELYERVSGEAPSTV